MGRALTKPHLRLLAIDDGAFRRTDRSAPIALVAITTPAYVEGVALGRVTVDATDATPRVIELVQGSAFLEGARALLVDGVTLGGFNVLDLARLHRALRIPVVSLTRRPPEFERIREALAKYFPKDHRRRWGLVRARPLFRIPTPGAPLWASATGCTRAQARTLIARATVRGYWPEPLRLAHLIARAAGLRSRRPNPYRPIRDGTTGPVA